MTLSVCSNIMKWHRRLASFDQTVVVENTPDNGKTQKMRIRQDKKDISSKGGRVPSSAEGPQT